MKDIVITFFFFLIVGNLKSQDTLEINYFQGKSILLNQNLKILAEHYNIDLAEAQIQQAALWDNPLFVWNAEMYSIAQNRYFNFNNQKLIQIEYAFSISGKRINAIKEAKINKEIAFLALKDVMRAMIFEYSIQYYNLSMLFEKNANLKIMNTQFENVLLLNQKKLSLGIISENDLIRLNTERLSLLSEINENESKIIECQAELRKLLNLKLNTVVKPSSINEINPLDSNIDSLIVYAKKNRPDFLIAQKGIDLGFANLKKQRSEAIPNINLGYQPLDQGSNHVRPYAGMVFEMSIPIFNRNQGNINLAKLQIEQQKITLESQSVLLENEILSSFYQVNKAFELLNNYNAEFLEKINELSNNALINYEKRNISLIEFIDYQRSYLETQKSHIEIKNSCQIFNSQLEFVTGQNLKK